MKLKIIAVGKKMDKWVNQGVEEYIRRMPSDFNVELLEITPVKRGKHTDIQKAVNEEGERMLSNIKPNELVIALDVLGKRLSTETLAEQIERWMGVYQTVHLLIGGADGLSQACLQRADLTWSLSDLTYPHPLVRIVLAEQLYRAWSILNHHPYHRA